VDLVRRHSTDQRGPGRQQLRAGSLALAISAALLAACSPEPSAEVIAADGVLCDLTRRLAGADLRVACLLQPGEDPHQFRLTPQQSRTLSEARLVLINGYGLTPALADLPRAVPVAELAVPLSPELASAHDHAHDHHGHGERDPHVWHDPRQAAAMTRLIRSRLRPLKPKAAAAMQQRQAAILASLEQLHRWNQAQFATLPATPEGRRTLASGHRAFASLARAYGLRELPLVDGSSSSDVLRPQAIAAAVRQLQALKVPALFSEQLPAGRSLQRISALSGVPIAPGALVADSLAPPPPHQQASLMRTLSGNTCLIAEQLGGRCDRRTLGSLNRDWEAIR
jgi:ABC-type Zn uptake system ZnuABC Zn-binding protein ZnuA